MTKNSFFYTLFAKKRFIFFAFLNAVVMTSFTFVWLASPFWSGDEITLIQYTSAFKRLLFTKEMPATNRFIFIDVAWEKQLINKYEDDNSANFDIGKQSITNRANLQIFFDKLAEYNVKPKFILCDISFLTPSDTPAEDSVLAISMNKFKNLLIATDFGESKPIVPILKDVPYGLTSYQTIEESMFIKFPLVVDTYLSLPLQMYMQLYNKKYEQGLFFNYLDDKPMISNPIIDLRIRDYHLEKQKNLALDSTKATVIQDMYEDDITYRKNYLSESLEIFEGADAETIEDSFNNKIIILGDFEDRDIKETIYGMTPGALILLNVFLSLEAEDNIISIWFLLFLIFGYWFISLKWFIKIDIIEFVLIKLFSTKGSFLASLISYVGLLIFMSIISYYLFNIHLTILVLALYLNLVGYFIRQRLHTDKV